MLKILIADDDYLVTRALTTIIDSEDDLQVVASTQKANEILDSYNQLKPDVCLLDIRIGEDSGINVAKQILESDPTAKILLLTTFSDEEYIKRAIQIGVKGYLIKQNLNAIIPSIRTVQANQTVFSPEIMRKMQSTYSRPNIKIDLTKREEEVLELVASGFNNNEIAEQTFLSSGTVRNYISQLLEKLELRDRTQLAIYYYQNFK